MEVGVVAKGDICVNYPARQLIPERGVTLRECDLNHTTSRLKAYAKSRTGGLHTNRSEVCEDKVSPHLCSFGWPARIREKSVATS